MSERSVLGITLNNTFYVVVKVKIIDNNLKKRKKILNLRVF